MKILLTARLVLVLIAAVIWGYGHREDMPTMRLVGMGVMVIALLMRFVPKRWIGIGEEP